MRAPLKESKDQKDGKESKHTQTPPAAVAAVTTEAAHAAQAQTQAQTMRAQNIRVIFDWLDAGDACFMFCFLFLGFVSLFSVFICE